MEYLVNKKGLKSLAVADRSELLKFSMEKRIVPRCEACQALMSKGVISPGDIRLPTILNYSENVSKKGLSILISKHILS